MFNYRRSFRLFLLDHWLRHWLWWIWHWRVWNWRVQLRLWLWRFWLQIFNLNPLGNDVVVDFPILPFCSGKSFFEDTELLFEGLLDSTLKKDKNYPGNFLASFFWRMLEHISIGRSLPGNTVDFSGLHHFIYYKKFKLFFCLNMHS